MLPASERADLEAFVGALGRSEIEDKLTGDDLLEYRVDLETARAQASSPRPKRSIVRTVVAKLVDVVAQTGTNVAATVITKALGL